MACWGCAIVSGVDNSRDKSSVYRLYVYLGFPQQAVQCGISYSALHEWWIDLKNGNQVRSVCEVCTSNNSAPYLGKTAVNGAGKREPAEVDIPPEGGFGK